MAGNFNIKFDGNAASRVEQYEYSQSNLTHNASQAKMNTTGEEIDYGEVEDFDYESYLVSNPISEASEQPEQKVVTEEMIEEVKKELRGYGFTNTDIERLLKGEIALEDLYIEIENDPDGTRRRKIYESNYLMSLGSEFKSIEALKSDINKTKRELREAREAQGAFDFTEEEAAYGLIMALAMYGGDLDEIADTYIIGWAYEDENGVTRYEYSYNPNYYGGFYGATPIYYKDVYGDSKYLEEIRASLVETTKTRGVLWWTEEYTAYEWQGTEEQLEIYDRIEAAKEEAIANREAKRAEYQAEIDRLTTRQLQEEAILDYINQELDHYMENVDAYIHQPNFMDKCGMNEALRERAREISASTEGMQTYSNDAMSQPTKYVSGKEDGMAVIAALINNTGDFYSSSGYIFSKKEFVQITLSDATLKNYSSWLPFMQEEEKQVFNYIYNTEGAEAAYNYLEKIADELDNRWLMDRQQKDAEWAKEHPVLASIGSVFITPFEGMNAAFHSLGSAITGNKIRRVEVYSAGDTFRQAVSQDIYEKYGEGLAFLYSTGMSMADSIVLIAGCYATGGLMGAAGVTSTAATTVVNTTISATMMGSRAYVSTLNDALDRGLNDGQAVTLAFSSALVETLMESYSVGHLINLEGTLGNATNNMVRRITANISNPTLQRIAINSGYLAAGAISQGICEGEEEFCTEILNHYLDEMISGDLSNYNLSIYHHMLEGKSEEEARKLANEEYHDQILQAFEGGFLSGGIFGSGRIGVAEYNVTRKVSSAINTEYKVAGLTTMEQVQRNQIVASVLGIDSRYQTECINALAGNLTQDQVSRMNIPTLLAINEAVNNYQRYDSSITLENIFKNVSETNIENNIEGVTDYQAPVLKNIFNKLLGKTSLDTDTTSDTFNYIHSLPISVAEQESIINFIKQYEQMPSFTNVSLPVSVAMRLIEHSFSIPDQKNVGKQYARAAYFYLLNAGFAAQNAADIVNSHVKTILDNTTSFNTQYNTTYGFKMNFSSKMDASMQMKLLKEFEHNFNLLPDILQQQIKEVNFYDTYNPADVYWELNYNIQNFNSAATGGNGVINLWTGTPNLQLLAHEAAHCYDTACVASWGLTSNRISASTLWQNAMQADAQISGKTGVSDYAVASNSASEDFADCISLYLTNPAALESFPNRRNILLQYFKSNRLTQLSSEIGNISQLISSKYGHKFEDVLVGYYVYGAHVDSKLEQFLSKYTASEMYSIVGFKSLLENSKMYTYSDYYQVIPQAIDNLVKKYGLTNAIKIMTEYLNTGQETLLTRDDGIRFDIAKFGIEGFRNYVKNISNGSLNVHKLFSKYYLENEMGDIIELIKEKYGLHGYEQILYEHFIYGAQLDPAIAAYVDKYTAADFLDVLNLQQFNDTATMYSLDHYKKSLETAMDTLISKYGLTQAVKIFEEYLKTGDKFLLTRDNNVRFEISKFTMKDLNAYLQGMYNGKSIQTIFSEYQISKDIFDIQNQISKIYGKNVNTEQILYNYYVHGANLEQSIVNALSKYTAGDISSVLGISFTDSFSEYTTADYESALVLALQTLTNKYGFADAIKVLEDYFDNGDIFGLTRDNNVRFEIGKFDFEKFKNYVYNNNMTLLVLQNIDITKIDTSLLDLSSLTTEQIQQYLGNIINQGTQVDTTGFLDFKDQVQLAAFFGDVPSNIRNRLENNFGSETPKTLLEFKETLTPAEQTLFDNYLNNTVEGKWLSTLTSEEIHAINLYTKHHYAQINTELRTKSVSKYFDIIQLIDSALAKFTLTEDTILWRGVDFGGFSHLGITDFAGLQALVGQIYQDAGYMSTSPSYNCSFARFEPIAFRIKAPAGARGAYVNQLSAFYNSENEFLLGRDQSLRIDNVSKQIINGKEQIVIDATVVNINGTVTDLNTLTAAVNASNATNTIQTNATNNVSKVTSTDPNLQALSEFDQNVLFGYTIEGTEDTASPGELTDVFNELNITGSMIPLNVLNAIALNSNVLTDVLNEQIDISNYNQQELKMAVEYYITSSLKLMEQNGLFDYELIDSVLSSDMASSISQDFIDMMLEKSLKHYPFEAYTTLLTYLGTLDANSKYYYLLQITGLELDSDVKIELLEKLFENKELRECTYANAYNEWKNSMQNTFGITDETVIEELLNSLIGSKDAFINEGIHNSELNWKHFIELLSPYIKEKVAVYDPSKPPVLWSKVDCSQLNTKYTTIENSTIGEGLYFLDMVFSNWNSDNFSTPKLETLWNLLSEEFARDLCQMKIAENSTQTVDGLRFVFPGMEDVGGPFGDIFKNVEFIEILKNSNIKTLTLDAVLSDDVFTSKYSSVTIDLDYFRQLMSNYGSSYSYEVAFEEFKGIVAAKFLNENFTYFDTHNMITSLMNNITTGTNKIAFTTFKNHLTETIFHILF